MKTLTSETAPLRLDRVAEAEAVGGWLALTLAPGKRTYGTYVHWQRDLAADLDRLVAFGVSTLAPLVTDDELVALEIPGLVPEAEARGLVVRRFPFHDGSVPEDLGAAAAFVDELAHRLEAGERIVVHCNGGLGRAGTIGACARLRLGLDPDAASAIASIRRLRADRAVETLEQERFVARYAAWLA